MTPPANPRFVIVDTSKILNNQVLPLEQDPFAPVNGLATPTVQQVSDDMHSVNPFDAGMRLVLPGAQGVENTYYVRVRSSNLLPGDPVGNLQDPARLRDGLTTGAYRLQVRLQQDNEVPGSTVQYADIRFATTGIEVRGVPGNSPLLGPGRLRQPTMGASTLATL